MKLFFDIETFADNELDVLVSKWNPETRCLEKKYRPNPLKEKIICISVITENGVVKSFARSNEKIILEEFWKYIDRLLEVELIGFNCYSFDYRYLVVRSWVNSVTIEKYNLTVTDLRIVLNGEDKFAPGTLADFAKALCYEIKTSNGSTMREKYLACNWEPIIQHCEEDCYICKLIYEKAKECQIL